MARAQRLFDDADTSTAECLLTAAFPRGNNKWPKAKLRHGRKLWKYIQHGDTAYTAAAAKYMGIDLDSACISAVAAVSVVPPC